MNIKWIEPDWSYLLGVVHGDGSVAPRSIDISVGYKDAEYADVLLSLWRSLGFNPKVYRPRSALKVSVHSKSLRDAFAPYKNKGKWSLPRRVATHHYLAGVFDTDGCVSAAKHKHISIGLKRSGNLEIVAKLLAAAGVRPACVKHATSTFNGMDYEVEVLKLSGMDRIVSFSDTVRLRHPRKAQRLREMRAHVDELLAHVPLWRRVAEWLQEEPRTCEEISKHFGITWDQVQSALQRIKSKATVKIIPPPRNLTRYRVTDLS